MSDLHPHLFSSADLGRICGICQTALGDQEPLGDCPSCSSTFHEACWRENGGCAIYGCALVPPTVKAEGPVEESYWGQETKGCPQCGQAIRVAALRCRFCGAVFDRRAPQAASEYVPAGTDPLRGPRQLAIALFVGSLVPCTAPIALLAGGIWLLVEGGRFKRLPSTHRVLIVLSLVLSSLVTAFLIWSLIMVSLSSPSP